MSLVTHHEVLQAQLGTIPVVDGQFIVAVDTGNIYRDIGGVRRLCSGALSVDNVEHVGGKVPLTEFCLKSDIESMNLTDSGVEGKRYIVTDEESDPFEGISVESVHYGTTPPVPRNDKVLWVRPKIVEPIQLISYAETENAEIQIPEHQVGDLILIGVKSATSAIPVIPNASNTVPVWEDILNLAYSTFYGFRAAFAIATEDNHTTGNWGVNARLVVLVFRNTVEIGAKEIELSANYQVSYPALTLERTGSTVVRFFVRNAPLNAYTPVAWERIIQSPEVGMSNLGAFVKNGLSGSVNQDITTGESNGISIGTSIELKIAADLSNLYRWNGTTWILVGGLSEGVTDHAMLDNLDAPDSGHTGFMMRGVGGNYTEGAHFPVGGLQAFLDDNVNNRFFDTAVTITVTSAYAGDIFIQNTKGFALPTGKVFMFMGAGKIENLHIYDSTSVVAMSLSGIVCDNLSVRDSFSIALLSNNTLSIKVFSSVFEFQSGATNATIGHVDISHGSNVSIYGLSTLNAIEITSLDNDGILKTSTPISIVSKVGSGIIIDANPGNALDTFQRKPLPVATQSVLGTTKLYNSLGAATDGAVTQKVLTDSLSSSATIVVGFTDDCDIKITAANTHNTYIQNAINALPAGGGKIVLREGTYDIRGTINMNKDNVSICGVGPATRLEYYSGASSLEDGFVLTAKNCSFKDFLIKGVQSLSSCTFLASYRAAPSRDLGTLSVARIHCIDMTFGIYFDVTSGSNFAPTVNATIADCLFDSSYITEDVLAITSRINSSGIRVLNCVINNARQAFRLSENFYYISGNIINCEKGVVIAGLANNSQSIISGNIFNCSSVTMDSLSSAAIKNIFVNNVVKAGTVNVGVGTNINANNLI